MLRRGDVVLASLDPAVGSEAAKVRPVVVVSNDAANATSPLVTIVPLTSQMTPLFDFQVVLIATETGLERDGRAQCEQVRAISKQRIGTPVGRIRRETLGQIDDALRLHLDL